LSGTRPSGMGRSPISYGEIAAYLALYPHDDPQRFAQLMRRMDGEWLQWQAKRDELEQKAKAKSGAQ